MCTSLIYRDKNDKCYFGRTLELTSDLPYQLQFLPKGSQLSSEVPGHPTLEFTSAYSFLAVTMPSRIPSAEHPLKLSDFKALEGMNDQGLTFSLLSYPASSGPQASVDATRAVLSASDLGSWALSQFATVQELREALTGEVVLLEALQLLGGVESPFHYVVHDATGDAFVIEFHRGKMATYDNPVGVMTNGPQFDWHLTNLDNYTFLSNVDKSSAMFGKYKAMQPDSGIATAGLPASNTSVGRFVRAAYYAQYTEAADTPDAAVKALAHIMNNFDRPRGVTIDYPSDEGGHLEVAGLSEDTATDYATEYTCWTNLSDLDRKVFYVRSYTSLNYTKFDLGALSALSTPCLIPLNHFDGTDSDGTDTLKEAKAA